MKLLSENEYGVRVFRAGQPVLICKFSDHEFCTAFPKSSWLGGETDDGDPFVPEERDRSMFRGDPKTDDFYSSLEDLKANALRADFGGPQGDLDLDKTDGRHYEVLGVLLLDHLEGEDGWALTAV